LNRDEKSFEDLLNQSEVKDWLHRAERDMFPKMKGSVLSLVIGTDKPDAKLALEVGAAVLFDKPLIVVLQKGVTIPAGLRRIAHTIVEIDNFRSREGIVKMQAAISSVLGLTPASAEGDAMAGGPVSNPSPTEANATTPSTEEC